MCLPEPKRTKYDEVKKALLLCFTPTETVQSLNSTFHNRVQQPGESLAEFSRALMRLYGQMEGMAEPRKEREALKELRNGALKEQFVRGAREVWVQRELRRISMSQSVDDFAKMREEAMLLFQDSQPQRRPHIREVTAESHQTEADEASQPMKAMMESQLKLLEEVASLRGELSTLKPLVSEVEALRTKVRKLELSRPRANRGNPRYSGRPRYSTQNRPPARVLDEVECYNCRQKGHFASNCPTAPASSFPENGPQQGNY